MEEEIELAEMKGQQFIMKEIYKRGKTGKVQLLSRGYINGIFKH